MPVTLRPERCPTCGIAMEATDADFQGANPPLASQGLFVLALMAAGVAFCASIVLWNEAAERFGKQNRFNPRETGLLFVFGVFPIIVAIAMFVRWIHRRLMSKSRTATLRCEECGARHVYALD